MTTVTVIAGDLMADKLGSVNPERYKDETFELYSIPAYDQGAPEILNGAEIGSSKQVVQEGDVLLSRIVPHIRRAWVVGSKSDLRKIGSGEWIVFRHPTVYPQYLRYYLLNDSFHSKFMQTVSGVGGSLLRARPDSVAGIPITLPPLPEQKRIAALLDKADRVRRLRRYAREMSEGFLQSVFQEMFGDRKATHVLGEVSEIQGGLQVSHKRNEHTLKKPYLRVANVQDGRLDLREIKYIGLTETELAKTILRRGDLLLVEGNGNPMAVGRASIWDGSISDCVHQNHLIRVRCNLESLLPDYLCCFINGAPGRKYFLKRSNTTSGLYTISTGIVGDMPVAVPSLREQRVFETLVRKNDAAHRVHIEAERQAEHLFQTLLHRAFAEG